MVAPNIQELVVINNYVKIYPTLYKLNTNGKLLVWYLEQDEDNFRSVSGQDGGLKTTSAWTTCLPKNQGKKNETSGIEQAQKECEALYKKKLKSSYFLNKDEVNNTTYIKPMLAETYYSEVYNPETNECKVKNNIPSDKIFEEGVVIQPKLDGLRCLLSIKGAYSRSGEKISGIPHIINSMEYFFIKHPNVILDGELYNHDLEFNILNGTIRRDPKEDDADQFVIRRSIEYHVYDIVNESIFKDRYDLLTILNFEFPKNVYIVDTNFVKDTYEVNDFHDAYVLKGYEGAILRTLKGKYQQGKRPKDLLKVKQFQDAEYLILDIIEGVGNNAGMASKIHIKDNNVDIYPNMTGSWEFCRKVLQEKEEYINGECTIKFFGRTPDGSLRHPIVKTLYKNKRDF